MNSTLNAVVGQRIEVTEQLIKLRIVPNGWSLPEFTPGQYGVLGLPGTAPRIGLAFPENASAKDPSTLIKRAYSVASSSIAREFVEFYVGLVRTGALSPRLLTLKQGDPVFLGEKFKGMFTLSDVPNEFSLVLVATGTGVAPYMSMLRTEVERGLRHRYCVIHGACHSSDLGYHSELKMLDAMSDKFTYLPILSHAHQEPVPWSGHEGFVQKLWTDRVIEKRWGFHPAPDNTYVFLCGNPLMINDMKSILTSEGFEEHTRKKPGQVHSEGFFVKV